MDKKEILERNKESSRKSLDEREQTVYNNSFGVGAIVVGVLCLIFSVFKAVHKEPFYELVSIITAYLCTTFIYQYRKLCKPVYLAAGIATGVAALISAVMFILVYAA